MSLSPYQQQSGPAYPTSAIPPGISLAGSSETVATNETLSLRKMRQARRFFASLCVWTFGWHCLDWNEISAPARNTPPGKRPYI
jgi:hypothetical protein